MRTVGCMPDASRPGPPGWFAERLLPWEWAERQLVRAKNYWIVTSSTEGIAHSRPLWGLWADESLRFSVGGPRMYRNLLARPDDVTVHLESGDRVVVLEGRVESVSATPEFVEAYNTKYEWEWFTVEDAGFLFEFRPRVGYGWMSDADDHGETFKSSGTRWRFER